VLSKSPLGNFVVCVIRYRSGTKARLMEVSIRTSEVILDASSRHPEICSKSKTQRGRYQVTRLAC
ncbi:MAG: hypothetical protein VX668_06620, partial [Planctomycetota bacterium]|nr:hypothetical protein [Planctomycetota bacterium]